MFGEFGQFLFVFQYLARKFLVRNSCQMSYSELRFPNLSYSNPIETNIDTNNTDLLSLYSLQCNIVYLQSKMAYRNIGSYPMYPYEVTRHLAYRKEICQHSA